MSDVFNVYDHIPLPRSKGSVAEEILVSELKDFEKTLTNEQELFIFCGYFGMRLYKFSSRGEYVIMEGVDDSGSNCRFVCNIHQLMISFRAVPKPAGQEEPRRIGFFDKSAD
ncbi:MAG: hypothetical protein J6P07_02080 [Spirochaetaceae bacterium]|nr:hypothetical protein [Spirochaetaceae bacterium]